LNNKVEETKRINQKIQPFFAPCSMDFKTVIEQHFRPLQLLSLQEICRDKIHQKRPQNLIDRNYLKIRNRIWF
jgi:hypothetical protein